MLTRSEIWWESLNIFYEFIWCELLKKKKIENNYELPWDLCLRFLAAKIKCRQFPWHSLPCILFLIITYVICVNSVFTENEQLQVDLLDHCQQTPIETGL